MHSFHKILKHMSNLAYNKCYFHVVKWAMLLPLIVSTHLFGQYLVILQTEPKVLKATKFFKK